MVNKIFIKGLSESAALYAASTEKYLHTEEPYEGDFEAWTKKEIVEGKGGRGYDVTSLSNICMSHLIHFLSMPFTAIREIYVPIKTSLIRDLGGDWKNNRYLTHNLHKTLHNYQKINPSNPYER